MSDITPADFTVGEQVTWLWTPTGGYGFTRTVPAEVRALTAKRVVIAAKLANGGEEIRRVKPDNLRHVPQRNDE
jgi:hypothetical protein